MLLPHMLRKLILPSISRSLALHASCNGTKVKLKNLVKTVNRGFVTDTVTVSVEGDWAAENAALNPRVGCGNSRSSWQSCRKRPNYFRLNRCWIRGLSCGEWSCWPAENRRSVEMVVGSSKGWKEVRDFSVVDCIRSRAWESVCRSRIPV